MTSRPAPGIQESLQRRGSSGLQRPPHIRRQPSAQLNNAHNPHHQDLIDLTSDGEKRAVEEGLTKQHVAATGQGPTKPKPGSLNSIQTSSHEQGRTSQRGKPQVFFTSSRANNVAESSNPPLASPYGSHTSSTGTTLPMPPRPGSSYEDMAQSRRQVPTGGIRTKPETTSKPAGFEPPAASLLFPGGKSADFYPWHGNHPEDVLSESLVKTGIINKPQIMNETNTARPSLWSNLKNKSGLSTLSSLFVTVLEKRQACGRLAATSTFKPPPRVTFTDKKRDLWLDELAKPDIGLRRLSKTIPHGIKGKFLLEQCLNKNIPVPRAVWLAKCVGSNELRSFKRKGAPGTLGVGGEAKWVRDWTISVEQFMESTIAMIGQADFNWKQRITYALRLATQLYKEHLLDQDHYLDWMLSCLDSSPSERLFLWLMLLPVYWQDLTAFRRRGKRMAESLLNHAQRLQNDDEENTNKSLSDFIEKLILDLLLRSPACLLLPRSWSKHGAVLLRVADKQEDPAIGKAAAEIDRRTKRLLGPSQKLRATSQSPTKEIVSLLDTLANQRNLNIEKFSRTCLQLLPDTAALVTIILQWASSIYREGLHRIYLAVRLIRKWNRSGFNTDDGILSFLHSMQSSYMFEPMNVIRVVAELVRSKNFSVGKYLQWLIATGSLSRQYDPSQTLPWHVRLVTAVPLSGLPEHVLNLRHTLLQGMRYPVDTEDHMLDSAQDYVEQQLPDLFESGSASEHIKDFDLSGLSATVRLELGFWLRQQVASKVEVTNIMPNNRETSKDSHKMSSISVSDFETVRGLMENFGDFSVLADILGIASTSLDSAVLVAVADTLNYHAKVFIAIGAFKPLFESIAKRYSLLRTLRFPERDLLVSLNDVANTTEADPQLLQMIAYDLKQHEQRNSVAACSPASDNMETLQTSRTDIDEEIERILSSGTSMDQQIMNRVFIKITTKLEEQITKTVDQASSCVSWFHRLRNFDEKTFERLMNQWLSTLLVNHQRKLILAALPTLVSAGCISMTGFTDLVRMCMGRLASKNGESAGKVSLEALDALLPAEDLNPFCQPQDAYRYRLEQQRFCQDPQKRILHLVCEALDLCSSSKSTETQSNVTSLVSSSRLRAIIRHFAVTDLQDLATVLAIGSQSSSEKSVASTKALLDGLLDPANALDLSPKSPAEEIATVVDIVDDLSLPFCQLELRQIFATNATISEDLEDKVSAALLDAIKTAVDNDRSNWSDLMTGLDKNLTATIREHAEREILDASTCLNSPSVSLGTPDEAFLHRYLTVVDFTASETTEGQSNLFNSLVDRLRTIAELLSPSQSKQFEPDKMDTTPSTPSMSPANLCLWLDTLLHLALVQISSLPPKKAANQSQVTFLWILRSLFANSSLQSFPSTASYLFDVAVFFSDFLPDEVRAHLTKLDATKSLQDPRCSFIFGSTTPPDAWLGLSSTPATLSTSSTSQPLSTPPAPASQQQGYSSQSPGPIAMQRSNSGSMPMQRSNSQQQQHLQNRSPFRQHPQPQKQMPPQLQRFASAHSQSAQQFQPPQQQQQLQHLMRERSMSGSPLQSQNPSSQGQASQSSMQSQASSQGMGGMGAKGGIGRLAQEKQEIRPLPFQLRRWEILPDPAGNPAGNETALSLSLFGARKV